MAVTPTFYTKKGEAIIGDVFQMRAAEVKTVDIQTLMPKAIRRRNDLGGMALSYTGHMLEMWGQIRLMSLRNGGSVDVGFNNLADQRSGVRNAVWSMPKHSSVVIAIGNAGAATTKALVRFSNGDSQEVEIPSFGTELIRRRSGHQGAPKEEEEESAEAVTIISADGSGNLVFAGVVATDDGSYTSSIRFYDTQRAAQQNLYATRFRLHSVKPRMLLHNIATQTITATPRFLPAPGDDGTFIDLPALTLRPNEIVQVDLDSLRSAVQGSAQFNDVSVQILNSGAAGS